MISIWMAVAIALAASALTYLIVSQTMSWAYCREDIKRDGGDPDKFLPWNWRVLSGPKRYFAWLKRHHEKVGQPPMLKREASLREYRDALEKNPSAEFWIGRDAFLQDMDVWLDETVL